MPKRSITAWQSELQTLLLEFTEAKGKSLKHLSALEFWKYVMYERKE